MFKLYALVAIFLVTVYPINSQIAVNYCSKFSPYCKCPISDVYITCEGFDSFDKLDRFVKFDSLTFWTDLAFVTVSTVLTAWQFWQLSLKVSVKDPRVATCSSHLGSCCSFSYFLVNFLVKNAENRLPKHLKSNVLKPLTHLAKNNFSSEPIQSGKPRVHFRPRDDADVRGGAVVVVAVLVLLDAEVEKHVLQRGEAVDVKQPNLGHFICFADILS